MTVKRSSIISYATMLFTLGVVVATYGCGEEDSDEGSSSSAEQQVQSADQPNPQEGRYTPPADTTPPKAPQVFAAVPGPSLGTITLSFNIPENGDYAQIDLYRNFGETAPDDCESGTLVASITEFDESTYTDSELYPGATFSYRACISDDAENVTEVTSNAIRATDKQRIFVSSSSYSGDMTGEFDGTNYSSGKAGADARCQSHAEGAGLSGTWKALLNETGTDVRRVTAFYGKLVNMAGEQIATNGPDLWSSYKTDHAIIYDENGDSVVTDEVEDPRVWTGFYYWGSEANSYTCNDWSDEGANGLNGNAATDASSDFPTYWALYGYSGCSTTAHLYCLETSSKEFTAPTLTFDTEDSGDGEFSIEVDFSDDQDHVAVVHLYAEIGANGEDEQCDAVNTSADQSIVHSFDNSAGSEIADDTLEETFDSDDHGFYRFYSCSYDAFGNLLAISDYHTEEIGEDHLSAFVTTGTLDGDQSGDLTAANALCESESSGTKALLSTSTTSAEENIGDDEQRRIFDLDGNYAGYIGPSTLFRGRVTTDSDGDAVANETSFWTGTNSSGSQSTNCTDWSTNNIGSSGITGEVSEDYDYYVEASTATCDQSLPIVCVTENP